MINIRILTVILFFLGFSMTAASGAEWKEFKRTHFIIYYKEAPLEYVETVFESAEQYYKDIAEDLGFMRYKGWSWDDRASIYIFDDQEDYIKTGRNAGWSHGMTSPRDKVIRTFPTAHGFFDSTLPHELTHIIFREFIGFKAQVPAWFEEGVAMNQEKAKRWGAHDAVRKAIAEGTFKNLDELTITHLRYNASRDLVDLFYAESASAVNFLISEYGDQRFVRFCRKLKDGDPFAWALESVYVRFKNVDDLNEAWVKFLTNG